MRALWMVLLLAAPARADDLLSQVEQEVGSARLREIAERTAAEKAGERAHERSAALLERAAEKIKDAHAKLRQVQDEIRNQKEALAQMPKDERAAERAKQRAALQAAKDELAHRKATAAAMAEAARALDAAARAVAHGDTQIEDKLEKARADKSLALAAQALGGVAAYERGDHRKATSLLTTEVIAGFPGAARHAGLAQLAAGDKETAWKTLRAAPLAAGDVAAQLAVGQLAEEHRDAEAARVAYAAAFAAAPSNRPAAAGLVRALFALGRGADAAGPLTVLASNGSDKESNYLLALVAERAGDPARAELALGNVVGAVELRHPPVAIRSGRLPLVLPTQPPALAPLPDKLDEASARVRLAAYRLSRGDHESAGQLVTGLERPDALTIRGIAELRAGHVGAARATLEKATQLDAKRADARQALGVALLLGGDAARAHDLLAKLPSEHAQLADALALAKLGKSSDAENLLRRLAQRPAPIGDAAATDLAILRKQAGATDAALKAMPEQPQTPEGWLVRGLLLLDKNDAAAATALRHAVDAAPGLTEGWMGLARAEEAAGHLSPAQDAARRALDLAPDLVEAHTLLARIYGKQGDPARKAEELARVRELGQDVEGAVGEKHTIAVVAFDNASGDGGLDWMRQGVAEALATDLSRLGSLRLIERTQVAKAVQEQKLSELGFTDPATAAKVGKITGADALLVGAIHKAGGEIRLDGRIIEVGSGKVLKAGSAHGTQAQLFDVERHLALDLVGQYALVTSRERTAMLGAQKPSLEALETASRIRMLSAEGKAREARAAYERLLKEDPDAAKKLDELKKSWSEVASTIAVLPLNNVSGRTEDQWLGVGLAEALTTDLKKVGLFLVERQRIENLMQERRLAEIVNDEQAAQVGKLAGAQILLLGSYQVQGTALRVDARLVDVNTSQVLQTYSESGRADQLFDVEARLAKDAAAALKVEPSEVEKASLGAGKPSLDDFKRYIQASSKLAVKEAPAGEISVRSLAVGDFKTAAGALEPQAAPAVRSALERHGKAPVRLAASSDPAQAGADALVVGTLTRVGSKLRIDARAVLTRSGEVVASATSLGDAANSSPLYDQVADNLLVGLGLRRLADGREGGSEHTPVYKRWWLWTAVGVVAAGAVVAGVSMSGSQSTPHADATITLH